MTNFSEAVSGWSKCWCVHPHRAPLLMKWVHINPIHSHLYKKNGHLTWPTQFKSSTMYVCRPNDYLIGKSGFYQMIIPFANCNYVHITLTIMIFKYCLWNNYMYVNCKYLDNFHKKCRSLINAAKQIFCQ